MNEYLELRTKCPMCCTLIMDPADFGAWTLCNRLDCLASVLPIPVDEWSRNGE